MTCLWSLSPSFSIWWIFFYHFRKILDNLSTKYDRFVLLGDFNVQENEIILPEFLNAYNAKNIVKTKTCFKSIENPTCVDLIITDKSGSFQHTDVFETGISDDHKLVTIVMKAKFTKASSKYVHYRNYKNFNEQDFKLELRGKLKLMLLMQLMRLFTMSTLMYLISMHP